MLKIRESQMRSMAAASPGTPMIQPCAKDSTWIEIRLVDQDMNPVPGARYRLQLPDFSIQTGALDKDGRARCEQIVPGQAQVQFPEYDGREWTPLGGS